MTQKFWVQKRRKNCSALRWSGTDAIDTTHFWSLPHQFLVPLHTRSSLWLTGNLKSGKSSHAAIRTILSKRTEVGTNCINRLEDIPFIHIESTFYPIALYVAHLSLHREEALFHCYKPPMIYPFLCQPRYLCGLCAGWHYRSSLTITFDVREAAYSPRKSNKWRWSTKTFLSC